MTLTLKEAADLLGIRVRTMREWVRNGKIEAEKDENGWRWIIREEEVGRCLQKLRTSRKN